MASNQPVSFLGEAFKETDLFENNPEQEVASTAYSESKRTIEDDEDDNLAVSSNSLIDRANDLIYSTFLQITMDYRPSTALEYLNIFLEDLQPISYAFDYKLFIPFMPGAFQTMMNLLQYRGESYSFRKFITVFSLCIAAIMIFYSYFSYVMISCWVSKSC
jgi:hypothetical protein